MVSVPSPEAPAPAAQRRDEPRWARNVSWILVCTFLALAVALVIATWSRSLGPGLVVGAAGGVAVGWTGIKRGWATRKALDWGWLAVVIVWVPLGLMMVSSAFAGMRPGSITKAVLNNARALAGAASQYYQETGATTCAADDLIGPTRYLKAVYIVQGETYPAYFTQGVPITVRGISGVRTITYAP